MLGALKKGEKLMDVKRSKYSSAYRFGFSVVSKKWGHFAQVHRFRIQNEVLSVSKCCKVSVSVNKCQKVSVSVI